MNQWWKYVKNMRECQNLENPNLIVITPVDNIVKNHLKVIILSMLLEKSMCGYDLIKQIVLNYNVLVSQGTVYPLLYSLKEEGILKVDTMKGDMKTKRYSVNEAKKATIEIKIDGFIKAEEFILNSLR